MPDSGKSTDPILEPDPLENRKSAEYGPEVDAGLTQRDLGEYEWRQVAHPPTRMDKAIDFLLGEVAGHFNPIDRIKPGPLSCGDALALIGCLELTRHRHELPNRQRLLALVEAAMPKEAK